MQKVVLAIASFQSSMQNLSSSQIPAFQGTLHTPFSFTIFKSLQKILTHLHIFKLQREAEHICFLENGKTCRQV
ncbi:MAG: hypothetical protein D8M57_01095 [Candidatus Scalindua sp. AMX11]|nr:MAG: hypothetical protein DWQ00_15075 [Candidatus Scalindua sp.]TDE66665.1 MAG: hypothetical protein D8M57_01095 [Candidatus Scalindua sp. AMX11]